MAPNCDRLFARFAYIQTRRARWSWRADSEVRLNRRESASIPSAEGVGRPSMRALIPYGDRAVLVVCDDQHPGRLAEALRRHELWDGAAPIEVVPGARTVLLTFSEPVASSDLTAVIERASDGARGLLDGASTIVEIEVDYD